MEIYMADTTTTPATDLSTAVDSAAVQAIVDKKFWQSKTFWANVILAGAILLQMKTGFLISPDLQGLAITGINLVLRKFTSGAVTLW
jgi:hypothetical protein